MSPHQTTSRVTLSDLEYTYLITLNLLLIPYPL